MNANNMNQLKLDEDEEVTGDDLDFDGDNCHDEEIQRLFIESTCICKICVDEKKSILHLSATEDASPNIAIAPYDNACIVYTLDNYKLSELKSLKNSDSFIVGVKFNRNDKNLLYVASEDGVVNMWDLRIPKTYVQHFTDTTVEKGGAKKSFTCFDTSCNERLLTVGTNLSEGDAFMLFWDIRKGSLLGGYWESHTDDITQVKFHDTNPNQLTSGSTDGLINVFDLTRSTEDDALTETFNSMSSVEKLQWFDDELACITHTVDLQFWRLEDAEPYLSFKRKDISKGLMRTTENYVYIINVHRHKDSKFLLAGTNYADGERVRGLNIGSMLEPCLSLGSNKQTVECSWYLENSNLLLTAGDRSLLNVWKTRF